MLAIQVIHDLDFASFHTFKNLHLISFWILVHLKGPDILTAGQKNIKICQNEGIPTSNTYIDHVTGHIGLIITTKN